MAAQDGGGLFPIKDQRGGLDSRAVEPGEDATVSHQLLHCLNPGNILCGNRAFCTYPLISCLLEQGVFSLMRLHQARHRAQID